MWYLQKGPKANADVQMLRLSHIFTDVTEQTCYTIAYELSEERTVPAGTMVCRQSKRSYFNAKAEDLRSNRTAKRIGEVMRSPVAKLSPELGKLGRLGPIAESPESRQGKFMAATRDIMVQQQSEATSQLTQSYESSKECVEMLDMFVEGDETDGIYFILEGKCTIRNPRDEYNVATLQTGDFFGESESLETMGYNYFGDVWTLTPATFRIIPRRKVAKIPEYDRARMKLNCTTHHAHLSKLVAHCADRYGGNRYKIKY